MESNEVFNIVNSLLVNRYVKENHRNNMRKFLFPQDLNFNDFVSLVQSSDYISLEDTERILHYNYFLFVVFYYFFGDIKQSFKLLELINKYNLALSLYHVITNYNYGQYIENIKKGSISLPSSNYPSNLLTGYIDIVSAILFTIIRLRIDHWKNNIHSKTLQDAVDEIGKFLISTKKVGSVKFLEKYQDIVEVKHESDTSFETEDGKRIDLKSKGAFTYNYLKTPYRQANFFIDLDLGNYPALFTSDFMDHDQYCSISIITEPLLLKNIAGIDMGFLSYVDIFMNKSESIIINPSSHSNEGILKTFIGYNNVLMFNDLFYYPLLVNNLLSIILYKSYKSTSNKMKDFISFLKKFTSKFPFPHFVFDDSPNSDERVKVDVSFDWSVLGFESEKEYMDKLLSILQRTFELEDKEIASLQFNLSPVKVSMSIRDKNNNLLKFNTRKVLRHTGSNYKRYYTYDPSLTVSKSSKFSDEFHTHFVKELMYQTFIRLFYKTVKEFSPYISMTDFSLIEHQDNIRTR